MKKAMNYEMHGVSGSAKATRRRKLARMSMRRVECELIRRRGGINMLWIGTVQTTQLYVSYFHQDVSIAY
jgi:hypothetical protein